MRVLSRPATAALFPILLALGSAGHAAEDFATCPQFFADARLRSRERAPLEDYKGSGYDRGPCWRYANRTSDCGYLMRSVQLQLLPALLQATFAFTQNGKQSKRVKTPSA